MFKKHVPIFWQLVINRLQRLHVVIENLPKMRLPGKIAAIGNPYRKRVRAKLLANFDALNIMFNSLLAC